MYFVRSYLCTEGAASSNLYDGTIRHQNILLNTISPIECEYVGNIDRKGRKVTPFQH